MEAFMKALDAINGVIWHDIVLYIVLGVGVLFTLWSAFCQYRALTHGTAVVTGKYDDPNDPGAISHFQALSAALSATVGLGNIGGVAVAIALGGPGAVFWMWMIGLAGMALKTTEVALSMIYRRTDEKDNPHGGPMFVAAAAFAERGLPKVGIAVGGVFCITLLISAITGGNMFQAWNVAGVTHQYFGVPQLVTGAILAVAVGAVILGGIKRIGSVAGVLVPFMCVIYLVAAIFVVIKHIDAVPAVFSLIFESAFSDASGQGAFIGGSAGYAFLWGMKRALFSSESGQGSSPIAHSAAKTDEPIREAVVAGLEPFIDTLVVCTLTSLVILSTGTWNRGVELEFPVAPAVIAADTGYTLAETPVPAPEGAEWIEGTKLFAVVEGGQNTATGMDRHQVPGVLAKKGEGWVVQWSSVTVEGPAPKLVDQGAYFTYAGATLTAKAFDQGFDGLGKWLVTFAAWLFAISTMISWSYYGEQGIVFLMGLRAVKFYRVIYCGLVVVACIPWLIKTDAELDALTALGTGVMLWANIPIMLIFGGIAMKAYHDYFRRLKSGALDHDIQA